MREPKESQGADDAVGEVELSPAEAVAGRGGKGVVVVVPAFAEAEESDDDVVAALVVRAERAVAPEVADGVDLPGDVVDEEDPRETAP